MSNGSSAGWHGHWRRALMTGLVAGLFGGCFFGDETEGLPCTSNDGCDLGLECAFGYCRFEDVDTTATCGDGETKQGEFCHSDASSTTLGTMGGALRDLAIVDFDGDGLTDILTVSEGAFVHVNDGNGGFVPMPIEISLDLEDLEIEVPDTAALRIVGRRVGVGQLEGTELPDLVLAVDVEAEVEGPVVDAVIEELEELLWLGENLGNNELELRPLLGTEPYGDVALAERGLLVGNFDGGGELDVVVVTEPLDAPSQGVFMEGGGDTLGVPVEVMLGGRGTTVAIDVDGDGLDDLVTADPVFEQVSVVRGPLGGLPPPMAESFSVGGAAGGVTGTDADGDGNLDLVVTITGVGFEVWMGDGTGAFTAGWTVEDAAVESMVAADLDGDGNQDLASVTGTELRVHPGYGDGTFSAGFTLSSSGGGFIFAAPLDSDGVDELVFGNPASLSVAFSRP
ncbi:MAG: VCBS repeat-containing protein [Deltaproteobacteria bacterium]|nr:VCBS repeat-containing protein [Deltaproteobacteria bacterium]